MNNLRDTKKIYNDFLNIILCNSNALFTIYDAIFTVCTFVIYLKRQNIVHYIMNNVIMLCYIVNIIFLT